LGVWSLEFKLTWSLNYLFGSLEFGVQTNLEFELPFWGFGVWSLNYPGVQTIPPWILEVPTTWSLGFGVWSSDYPGV